MTLNANKISKAIVKISKQSKIDSVDLVEKIINFLEEKKMIFILPKIIKQLEKIKEKESLKSEFTVISKFDPEQKLLEGFRKKLKVPASLNPKIIIDKDLQGGAIASYNFVETDQSFVNINHQLQNHLTK